MCKDLKSVSRINCVTPSSPSVGVTIVKSVYMSYVTSFCAHCSVTDFLPFHLSGKILLCRYIEVYVRLLITALHSVDWTLIIG